MPKPNPFTEIRRENLRALVAAHGQTNVAKAVGKPDRQIADLASGRAPSFGEKVARDLEAAWEQSTGEAIQLDVVDGTQGAVTKAPAKPASSAAAPAPDWPFRSVLKKWVTGLSEAELHSLDVALFAALKAIVAARPGPDPTLGNVTIVGGLTPLEQSLVETKTFAKRPEKVK